MADVTLIDAYGASSTVTLTSGTFPTTITNGVTKFALTYGGPFYTILTRDSGTQLTLRAGLAAWPGMHMGHQCTGCGGDPQIILPLTHSTKENDNG